MNTMMELSELSSTPPSVQHRSILVNRDDDPLKINLQAVELEGRPRLVRLLKSSGALVVSNAKEASIILVDSTTESGKRLIRTWGRDASKVVLEHIWARASIDAGRPLLEADNWGGAMTIDDGKPVTIDGVVVDEDELEVEALVTKSPLPTPRVTPVHLTAQRPETVEDVPRSEHSASVLSLKESSPPGSPLAQSVVVGSAPKEPMVGTHNGKPLPQSPPLPPVIQPQPYPQPTLFAQPSQPQNTYAYAPFAVHQTYPPTQSQMMPSQPFTPTGFPSSQSQIIHAPSVSHTPIPSVQSPMMQMTQNTPSINGTNLQTPNLATIMTIMEVVRHMDQSSWFSQNQLPISQPPISSNISASSVQPLTTPAPTPSTSQAIKRFESPEIDASLSSSQDYLNDAGTPSRKCGSISEDRSMARKPRVKRSCRLQDEISNSSVSRKRPPVAKPTNPPPKRLRKSKGKAVSADSFKHSDVGVDEFMAASDVSYSTHSSASPSSRPRNIVAHRKRGEIFLSSSGHPLQFFVQVDLHGRHNVVTNIKKNKGKIVNNIADADYLILFTRSDTFQGLLNEAVALGKVPILAAFVADCIEECALLDETDYILESVGKVKALKRGRQNAFSIKIETPEAFPQRTKTAKRSSTPATGEVKKPKDTSKYLINKISKTVKSTPSETPFEIAEDSMASRSPTPPPAATRQMMKTGKYLFTEPEDEYFLRLAGHYLNLDPTVSNTALVLKLHKKMPHHSFASWGAHIDKKLKGQLEDVRKRANIAKRKHIDENASQNLPPRFAKEGVSSKECVLEGSGDVQMEPSHPSQDHLERQDFDVITQFFASGGGDDDDDERVWQELEKHQKCLSASSWPEYYAAHEKEVFARIEELVSRRDRNE